MARLQDKVAIITGGASGIGRVTAHRFAEEGATALIWDLNDEKGQAVVKEIEDKGGKAEYFSVNTADYTAVEAAAQQIHQKYGAIHVLVNNAGITRDASLKKMTPEQFQAVIDVNLTGVFNCTKVVSPYMIEKKFGRIISTSSVVGIYGNFGQTNYVAAKSGVIGMTKVWARELGRKGVTANAVAPGFIETEMTAKIPNEVLEGIVAKVPVGRMGSPADIANAYVFLASDEAGYVNGATISVDGGMVG